MDQMPGSKYWNRDFIQREKVGRKNKRYYKRGPGYICQVCPYASNKTCGMCIYAKWNVDGIAAGFSPSRAYREAHKDDISASPLVMQFDRARRFMLPPVDTPRLNLPPQELNRSFSRLENPTSLDKLHLAEKLAHVRRVIG